jgi:hypothetical protein
VRVYQSVTSSNDEEISSVSRLRMAFFPRATPSERKLFKAFQSTASEAKRWCRGENCVGDYLVDISFCLVASVYTRSYSHGRHEP